MPEKEALIRRTMNLVAEAHLHFDASVSSNVTYSETLISDMDTREFWDRNMGRNAYTRTNRGEHSRYGQEPVFSPTWLEGLTEEDHRRIEAFLDDHYRSYWAVDGLFEAIAHQCLSSDPEFTHLLRNFLLLWDDTTYHVIEDEDCYSLCAIKGLGGADIGTLPLREQEGYRALAGFCVLAYLQGFDGSEGDPEVVEENVFPGNYVVTEPFRSMVMKFPAQVHFIFEYLSNGYSSDDEEHLWSLLEQQTPNVLLEGLI